MNYKETIYLDERMKQVMFSYLKLEKEISLYVWECEGVTAVATKRIHWL